MAACLAYGAYWLWASPVWRWNGQLHIVGNRLVSHAEILDRLHLQQGTPLYKLDPQRIAAQVTGIPAISQVAVHRWLFPARLELQVVLREWHQRIPDYRIPEGTVLEERGAQLTLKSLPLERDL